MIPAAHVESLRTQVGQLRLLVIGDLMLDRYLWGSVSRISPEAPVPVIDVQRRESRPGGAANVALNIAATGAQTSICGITGLDDEGSHLLNILRDNGFDTKLVKVLPNRPTTSKTRMIGNKQQMLRVDREVRTPLTDDENRALTDAVLARIGEFEVVIFEDYDKGVLSPEMIAELIAAANAHGIPTVVDPKFRNFLSYSGCTLFKPNLKELNEALGLRLEKSDLEGMRAATVELRARMPHTHTLITLSENGVLAFDQDMVSHHIPAHYRKITDVSGAGDSVIAMMGICLALGFSLAEAAEVANLAGGLVCEEIGVVPVDMARLLAELDAAGG